MIPTTYGRATGVKGFSEVRRSDHLEVVGAPGPNRFNSGKFLLSLLEQARRELKP